MKKFGDRKDAKRVRNLNGMNYIMYHLKKKRSESEVYIDYPMDVTELVKYLDKYKNSKDKHITYFHAFTASVGKVFYNRPYLNRFIVNGHFYERNDIILAFAQKVSFDDDSKEYIIALLIYFSNIYDNVDFSIAAAIAQIESGYTVQSMLNKNNVFGGMSGGGLIKYKNIEYGILSYVKLLSDGYFGKGLTTVEDIGRVYNPTYNENGVKIAKPSWVSKVNNAIDEFINMENDISIAEVLALKAIDE